MSDANRAGDEIGQAGSVDEETSQQLVVAKQIYPSRLPIIVLPSRPVFPKTAAPILVDTEGTTRLVGSVVESQERLVGLVLKREPRSDEPPPTGVSELKALPADVYRVGVLAQVLKVERDENTGRMLLLVGALERFELKRLLQREPFLVAAVSYLYEPELPVTDELKAYALAVINSVKELIQLNPLFKEELNLLVRQGQTAEPARLADFAAYLTSADGPQLQDVLETLDVRTRLEKVVGLLKKELDISKLQAKIRQQIDERVSKQQREFFLHEQLKAIKQELGLETDEKEAEISSFEKRLESRRLSNEARERIQDELAKLRLLDPSSPEFNLTRNYLDWLTVLPWGVRSSEEVTLRAARQILDADHYGLDDVKSRILEFIAAGLMKGDFGGSIICLVGPPGVGKTSVGKSVARALGRQFYRFSLGGMRDEAEIKGHRRTYIGAMPGKFLQALRVCKTDNPVIMLDEIDKVGASYRGDPASALLEALDPEQNREFLDHYLDVRFDLSHVLFIATANHPETIPAPLLDRMEVIKLSGYILEEKLEIARRYLVPRALAAHGIGRRQLSIGTAALRELIDGYAREVGVRSLEQQIRKIARKSALRLLEEDVQAIHVRRADLEELLGPRVYSPAAAYARPVPGVVMGLAWTPLGGDTLFVEATGVQTGSAGFKQTGQLGKVMVESSEIAYTLVRRLCDSDPECRRYFDKHTLHLHVPAGATPKDGPSAGITMASALYTLARGKAVRAGFAMTGELNLSGGVMPVGGIKEKVIAAKRAKVKQLVLPAANRGDFERLPDHIKRGLTVHFAATFDDVRRACLP
jgi:ATP-dependent Lon protease